MIPSCQGCQEEWAEAVEQVTRHGLHLATTKDEGLRGPHGHFFLRLVDDNGRVVME